MVGREKLLFDIDEGVEFAVTFWFHMVSVAVIILIVMMVDRCPQSLQI